MYQAALLVTIAAATAWAMATSDVTSGVTSDVMSGVISDVKSAVKSGAAPFPAYRAHSATQASQTGDAARDCSARYAALLDLAELARRDGKSSGVVVRALSDRRGAMSECLPMNRASTAVP